MARRVHPIDFHVGKRVRLARLVNGMSQSSLGDAVEITFQQIQKYEKGTNRISASRLFEFATILGVEISYFFQGADGHSDPGTAGASLSPGPTRIDIAILENLSEIEDAKLKRKLLDLIAYVANLGRVIEVARDATPN